MKFHIVLFFIVTLFSCSKWEEPTTLNQTEIDVDSILKNENIFSRLKKLDITFNFDTLQAIIAYENTPDSIQLYGQYIFAKRQFYTSSWQSSIQLFKQTLHRYHQHYGEQHPMVLELYNWLAQPYSKLNLCDSLKHIVFKAHSLFESRPAFYSPLTVSMTHKNLGLYYKCVGDYENMKTAYHKAYDVLAQEDPQYIGEAAWALVNLASGYYDRSEYWSAIDYNQQALPDLIKVYGADLGEGFTATVYNNLGSCFNAIGDYDKAISNLHKAIEKNLAFSTTQTCHDGVAANFKNIAYSNESIGDLERAKVQFDIALQILQGRSHMTTVRAGQVRIGLIRVLYQLNDLERANQLALDALKIEEKMGRKNGLKTTALLHTWLGKIYLSLTQLEKAEVSFAKAETIYQNNLPGTENLLFEHYLEVGKSYVDAQLFEEALVKLLKLHRNIKKDFNQKEQLGLLISKCYLNMDSMALTAKWLNYTTNASAYKLEKTDRLERQYNINFLLPYFETYAKLHHKLYQRHQEQIQLDSAILYLEEATNYVFQQRIKLMYTSFLHQTFVPIQEQLIELYEHRKSSLQGENIFKQFEISKAIKLLGATKAKQSKKHPLLPKAIPKQIDELESKIKFYETQVKTLPEKRQSYMAKLEFAANEFRVLKNVVQQQYPDYYKYRFKHQTITIAQVQKQLKDHQFLLEYFWGDQEVKAILISKDTVRIQSIGKTISLRKDISHFLEGINQSYKGTETSREYMEQYVDHALSLHKSLIVPFYPFIQSEQYQLIIIPDGEIHSIPFNALLQSRPNDLRKQYKFEYLIHRFTISRTYSATFQFNQSIKYERKPKVDYIGFAPYHSNTTITESRSTNEKLGFAGLPFSKLEVEKGRAIFGGHLFLNSAASKEKFFAEAESANILHCATHAVGNNINGGLSYLLFPHETRVDTSGVIYANEIYDLDLNAELAVIGACQSAKGTYIHGEGMISLAHAFSAAGAKSVCSTFWNLNDQSSYQILSYLFEEIKKGVPKNEALHNAQTKFIKAYSKKAHPYYWAVFNLFGDTDKISF